MNLFTQVPQVRILPHPPISCYHARMAKRKRMKTVRVDKEHFDAVLSQLLKMKPIPTKRIKSFRKRSPKPLFPAKRSGS